MKKTLLLVIVFIFNSFFLQAQEEKYVYKIIHKGKEIGTLYAKKEQLGDKIIYSNRTEIDTRIITKIEVDYNYKVVYKNNLLSHAYVLILFNGKEKTNTYTDRSNNQYIYYEDDDVKNIISKKITYSTVNLMFEEPLGINEVYAEEHGEFHAMECIAPNTYKKTINRSKSSVYKYKNGKLLEAEVDAGLITFQIIAE
jgi:hypothetical protein